MTKTKIYKPRELAQLLNISVKTLQRWDKAGILVANRTTTDRRFYTHEQYLEFVSTKKNILYVSGDSLTEPEIKQLKDELSIQGIERIEVVKDGKEPDGFARKQWQELLERCLADEIKTVCVYNESELPINGRGYYKKFLERMNVELVIIQERRGNSGTRS